MSLFSWFRHFKASVLAGTFVGLLLTGLVVVFTSRVHGIAINSPKDNDTNAIIHGGAPDTSSLQKSYKADPYVRAVFDGFRITGSDVASMGTTAVAGRVTKSGEVWAGNTLVATNAFTAGRQDMGSGDTRTSHNGVVYYIRKPSLSFRSNSLDAYVVMKNGQFAFAVIASCGNPVNATPKAQPKPNYAIKKEVQVKGESTWHKSVSVKPGTRVTYRFVADSNGKAPLTKVLLKDTMPNNAKFVEGTLKQDNVTQTSYQAGLVFGSGAHFDSVPADSQSTYTFDAVIAPSATQDNCTAETLVNKVQLSAAGLTPISDTATVVVQCQPKKPQPTLACMNLTPNPGAIDGAGKQAYTFTATASAANATINHYTFNFDNPNQSHQTLATNATTATSNTVVYAPGTYHPSVTVNMTPDGGSPADVSGIDCATTITVNQPAAPTPQTPVSATPTTPPPTTLINTGDGDILGIFAATTIAGVIAFRLVWVRRLGLNI